MLSVFPRIQLLIIVSLAPALVACGSQSSKPAAASSVSPEVWATVDGREIRRDTIEKSFRRTVENSATMSADEAMAARLSLLDQMITQDVLLAKATELKIDVPQSELDAEFTKSKANMPDDVFNKELSARNLTADDMREALRRDLMARKLLAQEVTAKVAVTDQDINEFFQANKAQFNLKEDAFHLTQIIVTPVKDAGLNNRTGDDATTPEQAAAKVQMLMERLKGGASFNDLAMDFSEEPQSATKGGDVGMVPMSALQKAPPKLRDAVLKSPPGTVTVVSMDGGHTIVGVVAKLTGGQRDPSMPDVHDNIKNMLQERREQLMRTAYLEVVRGHAVVANYMAQRLVEAQGKPIPTSSAAH